MRSNHLPPRFTAETGPFTAETGPFTAETGPLTAETGPFTAETGHILPALDDGPRGWDESLRMARIAVADGIRTLIATPHQSGPYAHNQSPSIRERTRQLRQFLDEQNVPLQVLPGADVRCDAALIQRLQAGEVITLGDHGKHVLLEMPHARYWPLDDLLDPLRQIGVDAVLGHPERNQGLLRERGILRRLVERGCLMQVTAASLLGGFGEPSRRLAEWMLSEGLVHFLASDAHGSRARRPLIGAAFRRAAELIGWDAATIVCCQNPAAVAVGRTDIRRLPPRPRRRRLTAWLTWRRAG